MKNGALGSRAVYYYKCGYSCSRCIIKAAEEKYGISAADTHRALNGINNGLGIGIICSIPIACIMVLGLMYDDESVVKRKRLELLMQFKDEFKAFNCCEIQKIIPDCEQVIKKGCDILENLIE